MNSTSADVNGRAVGPGHALSQVQGVGEAVRARFPLLGQPGLQLEGRPVHPHERPLRQHREHVARLIARHQAIEGARHAPGRGDQLTAAARRGRRAWSPRTPATGSRDQTGRRPTRTAIVTSTPAKRGEGRLIFWPPRPISWPLEITVQISTHSVRKFCVQRCAAIRTAKRLPPVRYRPRSR